MKISGGIRVVRDASQTDIVDTYITKTAGASNTPSSPALAATVLPGAGQIHFVAMSRGGTVPNITALTVNAGQGVTDDFGAYTTGTASLSAAAVAYDYTPLAAGAAIGAKTFTANGGLTANYHAWTISVAPGNLSPIVDAGTDQVVASGTTVTMAGSASDLDGTETHAWSFTVYASGSAPTITNGTTLTPTWPAVTPGLYTLRLRSTDNDGAVTDSFVNVIVTTTTARPVAVTAAGAWTNVGGAASIPAALADESDATLAQSGAGPSGDTLQVTFQPTPIGSSKNVLYEIRSDAASPTVTCVVSLMQGATTIASWTETALTDTWVERNRALTAPQLAAITDNTALSLRVTATQD